MFPRRFTTYSWRVEIYRLFWPPNSPLYMGIITHFEASGQQALKALGYDPGPVDGIFGGQTESAVRAFQQAGEIAADGVVGRVTWINIDEADQSYPALKEGATGLPVRRLQSRMSAVGFDAGVAYDVGAVRVELFRQSRGL